MKKAENCVDDKIGHITFKNDSLVFQFAKSKGHQSGEDRVGPCWGSTGQRFQVELTKTVTDGSPRTAKGTKYVTHHETACST